MWTFFQEHVLGMKWLNELVGEGLTRLGGRCDFQMGRQFAVLPL